MQEVLIKAGTYRNQEISEKVFPLVRDYRVGSTGQGFVTVMGDGKFAEINKPFRVKVNGEQDFEYLANGQPVQQQQVVEESEEEAIERIARIFDILNEMTDAAAQGIVSGLIVSGPPGIGKSYGVEKTLEFANFDRALGGQEPNYEVIKGSSSAIGLYKTLYLNRKKGYVTVFDDCDNILYDEQSLNLLKAALDSSEKRKLSWLSESRVLREEDIPNSFDFEGSIVFLTNINFETTRSAKLKPHLEAMMSRCHYVDLEIHSIRDRLLRIKQIVKAGMLNSYTISDQEKENIVEYIIENASQMKELSLRMVGKLADLAEANKRGALKRDWRELADLTCTNKRGR